ARPRRARASPRAPRLVARPGQGERVARRLQARSEDARDRARSRREGLLGGDPGAAPGRRGVVAREGPALRRAPPARAPPPPRRGEARDPLARARAPRFRRGPLRRSRLAARAGATSHSTMTALFPVEGKTSFPPDGIMPQCASVAPSASVESSPPVRG